MFAVPPATTSSWGSLFSFSFFPLRLAPGPLDAFCAWFSLIDGLVVVRAVLFSGRYKFLRKHVSLKLVETFWNIVVFWFWGVGGPDETQNQNPKYSKESAAAEFRRVRRVKWKARSRTFRH